MPTDILRLRQSQHAGTQHRRQGNRDDRRDDYGERHRHAELVEELPDQPVHKRDGHEHRRDGQRRCNHREADFVHRGDRRIDTGLTVLHVPVRVFQYDDRVVDDHADRNRERQQRHHVQREAHRQQECIRRDDRRRNCDRGDERSAKAAQEQQNHQNREAAAANQLALSLVNTRLHEVRHILHDEQPIAGWQFGSNDVQLVLRFVGHGNHVCARLLPHGQRHRRLTVQSCEAALILKSVFHKRDFVQPHDLMSVPEHDQVRKLSDRLQATTRLDDQFATIGFDASAGKLDVLLFQYIDDILSRQVVRYEVVIPQPDADLAFPVTNEAHTTDAVDRFQSRLNHVVGELRQLADRCLPGQHYAQHRRSIRVELLDDWCLGINRQFRAD